MKNLNDQEQKVLVKANELSQLLKERGIPYHDFKFYRGNRKEPKIIFSGEKDGFKLWIEITNKGISYYEENIREIKDSTTITLNDIVNLAEAFYWPVSPGGRGEKDNVTVIKFTTDVLKELKKYYKMIPGIEFKWKYAIFDKKLVSIFACVYDYHKQVIWITNGIIRVNLYSGVGCIYNNYTTLSALTPLFKLITANDVTYFVYDFVERFGRNITNLHI